MKSSYSIEQLREDGPPVAMAMLLKCFEDGEPFVTYGRLGDELQYQLGIRRIFPTHVGHVAGAMMKKIQNIDPRAPLINALITRGDGLPGGGVGAFFAEKYAKPRYEKWTSLPKTTRLELVKRERDSILRYQLWKTIYTQLFGVPITVLRPRQGTEVDGKSNGTCAESPEHRKLKEWVARNPQRIGLPTQFGKGKTEVCLPSGDEVDVLFEYGMRFATVEVKSCRSNEEDLRRGIYQCVKYQHVKKAQHLPVEADVNTILVTEVDMPAELQTRASLLGVKWKRVKLNKAPRRA